MLSTFGDRVREVRRARGLGLDEAARLANVQAPTLACVEAGRPCYGRTQKRIAAAFGVELRPEDEYRPAHEKPTVGGVARRIRDARKAARMTAMELSIELGLSHCYISGVERGKVATPSQQTLGRIEEILGVTL